MAIRDFLRSTGLPVDDLHELSDSAKRFPDGAQYRIEIPSTEGPRCLEAVLEQAAALDVRVHGVSQGSGVFMQTTYTARGLDETMWDAFAALVERNSGGFGGCCCPGFQSRRGRLLDHKNAEPAVKIFMRNVSWRSRCGPSAAAPTASGSASSHTSKTRSEPPSDSVLQWRLIDGVAAGVDDAALREAQQTKDAIRACELVCSALGA